MRLLLMYSKLFRCSFISLYTCSIAASCMASSVSNPDATNSSGIFTFPSMLAGRSPFPTFNKNFWNSCSCQCCSISVTCLSLMFIVKEN